MQRTERVEEQERQRNRESKGLRGGRTRDRERREIGGWRGRWGSKRDENQEGRRAKGKEH